jgi:hypothetical protein
MKRRRLEWDRAWDIDPFFREARAAVEREKGHGRVWKRRGGGVLWDSGAAERDTEESDKGVEMSADHPSGERPGRNIEDVERAPMESLLFGEQEPAKTTAQRQNKKQDTWLGAIGELERYASRLGSRFDEWAEAANARLEAFDKELSGETVKAKVTDLPADDTEYVYDPISNRKVSRNSSPLPKSAIVDEKVDIPVKTYKAPTQTDEADQKQSSATESEEPPRQAPKEHKATVTALPGWSRLDDYVRKHGAQGSTIVGDNFVTWRYRASVWQRDDPIAAKDDKQGAEDSSDSSGPAKGLSQGMDEPFPPENPVHNITARPAEPPTGNDSAIMQGEIAPEELSQYAEPMKYKEPNGKPPPAATISHDHPSAEELGKYQNAFLYAEPDGKRPSLTAGAEEHPGLLDPAEMALYGNPITHNEPDGQAPWSSEESRGKEADALNGLRARDVRASVGQEKQVDGQSDKSNYRKIVETLMPQYWSTSGETGERKLSSETNESAGTAPAKSLTGNYVRDFPEEFAKSWAGRDSPYKPEVAVKASQGADSAASKSTLQPALDRQSAAIPKPTVANIQKEADLYSKQPQGLETSYEHELLAKPRSEPALVSTYGLPSEAQRSNIVQSKDGLTDVPKEVLTEQHHTNGRPQARMPDDANHELSPQLQQIRDEMERRPKAGDDALADVPAKAKPAKSHDAPAPAAEPQVYKILAYDPTMQAIDVAETTSIVPDSAAPLTPAEVLLRLSNPAKFFPHFAPLRAEGYEIVSGSGDVLVFRKVREASTASTGSTAAQKGAVNPIDQTGRVPITNIAGNFASPTGYVNYNQPAAFSGVAPEDRFQSGIDVKREEPVFSGGFKGEEARAEPEATKPKKRNVGKRVLVGAAWVAGVSYALGVVGEYFKTGGDDGQGPRRL